MADCERVLGSTITTNLEIVVRAEEGTEVPTNADEMPTAEIRKYGVVVFEIAQDDVTHDGTGEYSFEWIPTKVGLYVIIWSFAVGGESYESDAEKVLVVAETEGSSDSALPVNPESLIPDIGEDHVCLVSAQFYSAEGNGMQGVYVRFTPDRSTEIFLDDGIIAAETAASSDETGALSLYLVRGVTGILAVTGVGVTRRITVPDVDEIDLKDLVDLGDDLLEVQTPVFYPLPRRS